MVHSEITPFYSRYKLKKKKKIQMNSLFWETEMKTSDPCVFLAQPYRQRHGVMLNYSPVLG